MFRYKEDKWIWILRIIFWIIVGLGMGILIFLFDTWRYSDWSFNFNDFFRWAMRG